jgi:2-polyprenyl-6-methoxyphenol hydroxylase-like FAD-dependent oxidoreductase
MASKSGSGDFQRDQQRSNGDGTRQRDRAIVMGGSMAGLAAARVLSDHYGEVILVERDRFGEVGEHRRGVPQGRHTHGLLASGLNTLEGFFPGLFQEAMNAGGLRIDAMRDAHWWFEGGEHVRFESGLEALNISRPLLEGIIRERVRRISNVRLSDGCQVQGLLATPDNSRVTGIKVNSGTLLADLVVDATGRGSLSPIWLKAMGYDQPKVERIEIKVAYTTRRFRRFPHHLNGASFASIAATPESRKGGVIAAQEGGFWIVTVYAYCGASAPTELPAFIEFARTLPASYIYDVISQAEPIGEAQATRFPSSVRRRYESMSRFPEGYLVLGDAVSSFNPVYGQGMSVAALEALELDKALQVGSTSLARRFFAQTARIVDVPWSIAAGNDLRMPGVTGSRTPLVRFLNWYVAKLHVAARHDSSLAMAFQKVASLLVPPQSLLRPTLIARVFSAAFSCRPALPAGTTPTAQPA